MTIRLTILDRHQTPILLNEHHVVEVLPRKQVTPVDAQQMPSTRFAYVGSIVTVVTGEKHNVIENIDVVERLLNPLPSGNQTVVPEPDGPGDGRSTEAPKKLPEFKKVSAPPAEKVPAAEE
jgi:hypothetical protein